MSAEEQQEEVAESLDTIAESLSSVRDVIRSLKENPDKLDTQEGISLLSLKHHLMLSYLNSLVLLSSHRVMVTLSARVLPPPKPSPRPPVCLPSDLRGGEDPSGSDLVDSMLEGRTVLDKSKGIEGRMRYQIEKLVRLSNESTSATSKDVMDDPLAFRPNPQNLLNAELSGSEADSDEDAPDGPSEPKSGIYRPPQLAPMPYTEAPRDKRSRKDRAPPTALNALAYLDPSRPALESTSGLGGDVGMQSASARVRSVRRMTEYEEENFTRLVMKKKDAKRRLRDEEALAMGGVPGQLQPGRRGRASGLEDEFGDVLRAVGRKSGDGDAYEELRERGKKRGALERARSASTVRAVEDAGTGEERKRKRSRFEKDVKSAKKRGGGRPRS